MEQNQAGQLDPHLEQAIRREVIRQLANVKPSAADEIRAEEWDFMCDRIENFPGHGWILHAIIGPEQGGVFAVWRMSRVLQAQLGVESKVKLTAPKR